MFEHPIKFRLVIPHAIAAFGGRLEGEQTIRVYWRLASSDNEHQDELAIRWDTAELIPEFSQIEDEIAILRQRDEAEARICARELAVACERHPGFREWLRDRGQNQ